MSQRFQHSLSLSDGQVQGIGEVVAAFSQLDYTIDHLISQLTDTDIRQTRIITTHLRHIRDKGTIVRQLLERFQARREYR